MDESLRRVFLIQGKFHKGTKPPSESRNNILSFARLAKTLVAQNVEFDSFKKDLDPLVASRLSEVRDRVRRRNFEVSLYYVTTGSCSSPLKAEAEAEATRFNSISLFKYRWEDLEQKIV